MARFVKGEVVVVPFPYSDLSKAKRRPALVIANLKGDDVVLCQIISQARDDEHAIAIKDKDFETGGLKRNSYIRAGRLFTVDNNIILYSAGKLKKGVLDKVVNEIVEIIKS